MLARSRDLRKFMTRDGLCFWQHGKWVEIGRTESIAHNCNPVFSRPIIVTYKGPEAAQQIQVHVVSYAYKMRNGMLMGECTLLLDDLVHARTARVLKLPLLSPDHNRANGSVMIRCSRCCRLLLAFSAATLMSLLVPLRRCFPSPSADSFTTLTSSGTRYDPSEAGTWVQLHLNSNFLPWINAAGYIAVLLVVRVP